MTYKNLNGTSDRNCPDGHSSWLNYYMTQNGLRVTPKCGHKGCTNLATVGAHVKKAESVDNSWYIIPSCFSCNRTSTPFEINANISPVRART